MTHASDTSSLVVRLAWVGLAVSIIALLAPLIDAAAGSLIADHVHRSFPDMTAAMANEERSGLRTALATIGGLGAIAWLIELRLLGRHSSRARSAALAFLVVGAALAGVMLAAQGTGLEPIVPVAFAVLNAIPVVIGLGVVALLWRHGSTQV